MEKNRLQTESLILKNEYKELKSNLKSLQHENGRDIQKIKEMELERDDFLNFLRRKSENQQKRNEKLKSEIDKPRNGKQENGSIVMQLINLEKKLGVLKGAGCYYGDDRQIRDGGPRDGFNDDNLRNVLKILDLGGNVNFKERVFFFLNQERIYKNSLRSCVLILT